MNQRLDDLIALAALGELTDAESAELDGAARSDGEVAGELAAALSAAAALQGSARQDPPAALRASILEAISAAEQEASGDTPGDAVGLPPLPADVVSIDRARRRRFAPMAAAAAVLLLVAGAVIVRTTNDSETNDSVSSVVEADDASIRTLDGALGESLTVVYSASEGALVVTGSAVPAPDADETYQLWLIGGAVATSVGTFRPDDSGSVAVRFGDADPADFVLGVTREPSGGSDRPTLPILASA